MEFYRAEVADGRSVPHIFGMSAAPASAKTAKGVQGLKSSLKELERNLHAQVVTVADRTSLEATVAQPDLKFVRYPPLTPENDNVRVGLLRAALAHQVDVLDVATGVAEYG